VDFFALLHEPRRPWLDVDALKTRFLSLSAEVHPDRVHESAEAVKLAATSRYTALNAAHNCLREPRDRIRHLLELELGHKPSDLTNVPNDLMDLFFEIGKGFREVDAFLAEKARATSPLLQVRLFERGQVKSDELGELRARILPRRDALLDELKSVDAEWDSALPKPLERLLVIWRLLSFYERWLAQIQERTVQLTF
jgi:curved DNA-binding protein CbpA